ncbi:3',5'-nucleoside bisphosphate phosphatase [Salvia divinorum]|uniref:3',5'-nucleoside bisphosphate phosphatase n=1 Tax=Salvia divinorum TaxID=28513 RepID=A0ABD1I9T4_SALDI
MGDKEKKKKKRGGSKRNMEVEQRVAYKAVREWVFLEQSNSCGNTMDTCVVDDDFGVQCYQPKEKLVFEFHCHTTCSDGFLSPTKLVERAHHGGVKVLALTDHDTMSGIPEAMEAARRLGIKIIPGVEISTIFYSRGDSGVQESVHTLLITVDAVLQILQHWRRKGIAPGRLHIARAMLEAGHVENLKQAFSSYLHDDEPAYSTGSEPIAEETVRFIRETGGVAVLAHPWALKNPSTIVRRLKDAGLHGIEVYRSDGKLSEYSDLADAHDLLKLGGSDYHGRGGQQESDVGSTSVSMLVVQEFLKVARPIWCNAIQEILENYIKDPSDSNLQGIVKFGRMTTSKTSLSLGSASDLINSAWRHGCPKKKEISPEFEAIKLELEAHAETGGFPENRHTFCVLQIHINSD